MTGEIAATPTTPPLDPTRDGAAPRTPLPGALFCGLAVGLLAALGDVALSRRADPSLCWSTALDLAVPYGTIGLVTGLAAGVASHAHRAWTSALRWLLPIAILGLPVDLLLVMQVLDWGLISWKSAVLGVALGALAVWVSASLARFVQPGRWPLLPWAAACAVLACTAVPLRGLRASEEGPAPIAGARPESPRLNVLVYVVDTLRADRLGAYGCSLPTSPEVDAFAADATVFDSCWATSGWTKPTTASLLTGLFPSSHAILGEQTGLVPEAITLAEVHRAAGWRTAGFSDNLFVAPMFGYDQGFTTFDALEHASLTTGRTLWGRLRRKVNQRFGEYRDVEAGKRMLRGAQALNAECLSFIDADPDTPFLAYVHTMEPHAPYEPDRGDADSLGFPADADYVDVPPQGFGIYPFQEATPPADDVTARLKLQYDAEVRAASRGFGEMLDALRQRKLLEKTVVVFVSDHGEEFLDHGGWTHPRSVFSELTHVPFIVRMPDGAGPAVAATRGTRVGDDVSQVDLLPSLLAVNRIECPEWSEQILTGIDVFPAATAPADTTADAPTARRPVLSQLEYAGHYVHGIRTGPWFFQLIRAPRGEVVRELYRRDTDPLEQHDVLADHADVAERLEKELLALVAQLEAVSLGGVEREIDPATAEHLRAIGYVGGK